MVLDLGDLSRYTFLPVGFWVVVVAAVAFALVYAVGPTRGKRAARMWVDSSLGLALLGAAADIVWALESGEVLRFVRTYGLVPIVGMLAFFALVLGIMRYMAIRYTDGLKDD